MSTHRHVPTILDDAECWSLLRSTDIGRLAVVVAGRPEIFPVNFVVDHGTLVFRTAPGTKTSAIKSDAGAAFEIDHYDKDKSQACSVVVHGRLEQLTSSELLDTDTLPLYPLQTGPKPRFVRIVAEEISGRRFETVDPATWRTELASARRIAWE